MRHWRNGNLPLIGVLYDRATKINHLIQKEQKVVWEKQPSLATCWHSGLETSPPSLCLHSICCISYTYCRSLMKRDIEHIANAGKGWQHSRHCYGRMSFSCSFSQPLFGALNLLRAQTPAAFMGKIQKCCGSVVLPVRFQSTCKNYGGPRRGRRGWGGVVQRRY